MAKRLDILDDSLEDWLRIGDTAVWIHGCLVLLAGLGFVIAKCAVAEFGTAFVGLVATISGVGLTALCWGALRLIRRVRVDRDRLQRLHRRIEELELEFEANVGGGSFGDPKRADDIASPIPGEACPVSEKEGTGVHDESRFQHALESGNLETCRQLWPLLKLSYSPDRAHQTQSELDELDQRTSQALREDFGEQMRSENYRAAIETGEHIVKLFPDSRMSADFQTIRSHLEKKAGLTPRPPHRENGDKTTS